MQTAPTSKSASERLLDAAMEVISREGLSSATTREIAKVAGVNEVTLFRNFQNKQGLLAAVLQRAFLLTGEPKKGPRVEDGADLREVVTHFAQAEFERKSKNIALMRVLVGDIHRLGDHEAEVLKRIFQPVKEELANQFREAQRQGMMRRSVDPAMIVDQLVAMIFIGALRADLPHWCVAYSTEEYLEGCVDTVVNGIAIRKEEP